MKVKILRNPAAEFGCKLKEGQVGEVDDKLGERLVKMGLAVETDEPETVAETIRAVPGKPAIGEAKAASEKFGDNPHAAETAAAEPEEGTAEHAEAKLKDYKAKAARGPVKP